MTTVTKHLDKYSEQFREHLREVDELAQTVLTGHLIIENALENVIALIFFHPEHLRLNFERKVQVARAYALNKNKKTIWNLIMAVNETRNAIAHSLPGDRREKKMAQLRRMYFAEMEPDFAEVRENYPDHVIAVMACALCTGFLGTLEDDTKSLRNIINEMHAAIHSE
jgi:hypothetical protein